MSRRVCKSIIEAVPSILSSALCKLLCTIHNLSYSMFHSIPSEIVYL